MKILHIDASARPEGSYSRRLSSHFIDCLRQSRLPVLSAAGGSYGTGEMFDGLDCLTPHIRAILGFVGVTDLQFIAARSMMFAGPDAAATSLDAAKDEAAALARTWSSAWT